MISLMAAVQYQNVSGLVIGAVEDKPLKDWESIISSLDLSLAADNYGNNLRDAHTTVCSYTGCKFPLPGFYDDPTSMFNLSLTAAENAPSKY
jgi:hypothetical protein